MPAWIQGDVLDVKSLVIWWTSRTHAETRKRRSMKIPAQLKVLGLPAFEGRQHSGIDDTRNIAKIVIELGQRDVRLVPNTKINPRRRWPWMGKSGQILEDCLN
jgi:3'-5' exoribonuclease 1